jgi:hypothetical protein
MKAFITYITKQIEWFKSFFDSDDNKALPIIDNHDTDHKNLLAILVVGAFCFVFLKVALKTDSMPDISGNWEFTILAILGIRAAQSAHAKYVDGKSDTPDTPDAK